ncbi:MAG TPA: hypothetical protein VGE04_19830 [Chloroflexia bacterium]|jgi:hypothetical protein
MKTQSTKAQDRGRGKLRAVETRRLTFSVSDPLERYDIANARTYALGGDEYTVPANQYDALVRSMKQAGFSVRTVWELYRDLPAIPYHRVSGGFWYPRPDDDPARWYYLSPITRRWRRVPHEQNRLVVRNGWALCHFPIRQKWPEFYHLQPDRTLRECKTAGDFAIAQGYAGVLGTHSIPYWEDNEHLYALWPGYVIPKEHRTFLTQHLSPHAEPLKTEMGELCLWRVADRSLIERCLRDLRLKLNPWSPSHDWISTLSTIQSRSYSLFLKKNDNLPIFQDIIRRRAWHELEDDVLRHLLNHLGNAEYEGDHVASTMLRFLSEKLPVRIDWRNYPGNDISTYVLESSTVEYQGRETGDRYHRVVLPDLEIVAGWQTGILPDRKSNVEVTVSHWRVLPFLGRMRTSSTSKITEANATEADEYVLRRALCGVPKVEWSLAEIVSMDAFSIDMDPNHWQGHYDLMRYFMGWAEVVRPNPAECDTPSILLRDMLGFQFVLEISGLAHMEVPKPGNWIRFIARTSLAEHSLFPTPSFILAAPELLEHAEKSEALYMTLVAAVKYHFGVTLSQLRSFFAGTPLAGLEAQALDKMIERQDIVQFRQRYYYRYARATTDQVWTYVARGDDSVLPLPYHHLRGILHPLWVQASALHSGTEELLQTRNTAGVLVRNQDASELIDKAIAHITKNGVVYISGIGLQRGRLSSHIVDSLVSHFGADAVQVRRCDIAHEDEKARKHPWRKYLVIHPMTLLRHAMQDRR